MSQAPSPAVLRLIRASLLFGVLAFGAVTYFTQAQRQPGLPVETAATLRLVVYGLVALVLVASFVLRGVRERARDEAAAANLTIIAWAIGETPALLGAVVYFLSGDPMPYLIGLVTFLLMLVTIRPPE
jgi:hypothetical protein